MRINTNIAAITANNELSKIQGNLSASLERLSSGYKINNSSDDPAGMAISQKMRSQLRGMEQASNNAADGISVLQTAEGAIAEVQSMLARMKELSVQAANAVNSDDERATIQSEINALNKEIDRVSNDTEFNTQPLLNGNLERRVYSNKLGVSQLECSSTVAAGNYGINITQDARQAIVVGGAISGAGMVSGKITADMEGTISINGYSVPVMKGDDIDAVVTKLMDAADKVGGSIIVTNNTANTAGTDAKTAGYTAATGVTLNTSSLVFISNGYGTDEKMNVKCDNTSLAAAFGISAAATDTGITKEGINVKAEFALVSGKRVGFSDTAKLSTDGTNITVQDLNSKKFTIDVPGNMAGTIFDDKGSTTPTTSAPINVVQEVTDTGTMKVHVGANENQTIEIDIAEISSYKIGTADINIMTHENASKAIQSVDNALAKVSAIRGQIGSYQNRLDHTTSNLDSSDENLTAALSRIIDTDVAEEMTNYTELNVLSQAATSMLSQANARPETVLQLLQK